MKKRAVLFFLFSLSAFCFAAQKIVIKANDKTALAALYQRPAKGKPVVLMLHGLASSKEEWKPFGEALEKAGWGWLAYDARGHGESSLSKDKNGAPDGYRYFGNPGPGTQWELMVDDVGSVVRHIEKNYSIGRSSIVLCGASVGANVALKFAALTNSIKVVVLLSPGLNYVEFKPAEYIRNLTGASVLMVASKADEFAYASSLQLKAMSPLVELWSDVKAGHGVQMFDQKLPGRIITWMKKRL